MSQRGAVHMIFDPIFIEDENIQANGSFSEALDNSLRTSQRERRSTIATNYQVYLGEADYDISQIEDPMTYNQVINCPESEKGLMLRKMR